jgi:drug/metabolite transporter (DMT)-like permease
VSAPAGIGDRRAALAGLAAIAVVWGINWPIMKVGVLAIGPVEFAVLRCLLGALTMFALTAALGVLRWPARADWPLILHLGVLQTAAFLILVSKALEVVGAGRSAVLAYTTPMWVAPLSVLLLGERLSLPIVVGAVLAMAGVGVLLGPAQMDWGSVPTVTANAMLLLAALLWSFAIVHLRAHHWVGSVLQALPWQLGVATLVLLGWWVLAEPRREAEWSGGVVAAVVFNGVVATGFAFWLMNVLSRRLPAMLTALASLAVPPVGVAASALALGEPITAGMLLGAALVLGGLALTIRAPPPRTATP